MHRLLEGQEAWIYIYYGAKLKGVNLKGSYLRYVDFTHADLRKADLRNTCLRSANFARVRLEGTYFSGATWIYGEIDNRAQPDLMAITAFFPSKNELRSNLEGKINTINLDIK